MSRAINGSSPRCGLRSGRLQPPRKIEDLEEPHAALHGRIVWRQSRYSARTNASVHRRAALGCTRLRGATLSTSILFFVTPETRRNDAGEGRVNTGVVVN